MAKRRPRPALVDRDNPEWTANDFARAKPAREVLSPEFLAEWTRGGQTIRRESDAAYTERRRRGAQKAPTKELISIRLSRDVLTRFRESGAGWQSRLDEALRAWLKRHSPEG